MNSSHCCLRNSGADDKARRQKTWLRRVRGVFGWILPGALLTLVPKCPMCLAAYVALGTGFTMSFSSAHILMRVVTALCIGTLALCVIRRLLSCRHNKQTFTFQLRQTHQ